MAQPNDVKQILDISAQDPSLRKLKVHNKDKKLKRPGNVCS